MGRKLTDAEWDDPDFQALFVALEKAAKPVRKKLTEIRTRAALDAPETAQRSDERAPPPASDR